MYIKASMIALHHTARTYHRLAIYAIYFTHGRHFEYFKYLIVKYMLEDMIDTH